MVQESAGRAEKPDRPQPSRVIRKYLLTRGATVRSASDRQPVRLRAEEIFLAETRQHWMAYWRQGLILILCPWLVLPLSYLLPLLVSFKLMTLVAALALAMAAGYWRQTRLRQPKKGRLKSFVEKQLEPKKSNIGKFLWNRRRRVTAMTVVFAGWLVLALWLGTIQFILAMVIALLLYGGWLYAVWYNRIFIVTSVRMLRHSGVLNKTVVQMPLKRMTDMGYFQSLFGRLFGYGKFLAESAGQGSLERIIYIPNSNKFYDLLGRRSLGKEDEV